LIAKIIKTIQSNFKNNVIDFSSNLLFILIFTLIFGQENLLPIVALSVGFLMFPKINFGVKHHVLSLTNILLFPLGGLAAQIPHTHLILLSISYLLFTFLIMILSAQPIAYQYSIPYLINFLFCQATPVSNSEFPKRFLALFVGSLFLSLLSKLSNKKQPLTTESRSLIEQVSFSLSNPLYILKMCLSITASMIFAIILNNPKPLWFSIVAMSLTEISFTETIKKTRDRLIGTLLGIMIFYISLVKLIPTEFAIYFILMTGFISYFLVDYRYKTIVNSIAALNAALLILPSAHSILNRLFALALGVIITYSMSLLSQIIFIVLTKCHIVKKLPESR